MPRTKTTALVQAAARPPEILTVEEDSLASQAIDTFCREVGGRAVLTEVLAIADSAPEVERIVSLLLDPKFERYTLRRLCKLAGLTVADLFRAYKKALVVRAHLQATRTIVAKLPAVVEDVMARAIPTAVVCPACGNDPKKRKSCTVCQQTGATLSEPDLDRQKLALELGHLTEKRGGLFIQQNQQVVSAHSLSAPGGGALEQLQQAVGELLFSPGRRRQMSPRVPDAAPIGDPDAIPVPHVEPPTEIPDDDDREPPTEDEDEEQPTPLSS